MKTPFRRRKERRELVPPTFLPGMRGSADWHIKYVDKAPYSTKMHFGTGGEMRLPAGDNARDQFTRTHELLHAAHSPVESPRSIPGVSAEALLGMEEFRLNSFAITQLTSAPPSDIQMWAVTEDAIEDLYKVPWNPMLGEQAFMSILAAMGLSHATFPRKATLPFPDPEHMEVASPEWATLFHAGFVQMKKVIPWPDMPWLRDADDNATPLSWDWVMETAEILQREIFDKWRTWTPGDGGKGIDDDLIEGLKIPARTQTPWTRKDEGDVVWGAMTIHEPRLTHKLPLHKRPAGKKATDMGIAPVNIHRLLIDGKCFSKKKRLPSATMLIDASGSMSWSDEQLRAIIEAVPATTIATYSGDGFQGELWIIAKDGKWVPDTKSPGGGNDVDLPAIEWLATQPGPRIWVTDGIVIPVKGPHVLAKIECAKFAQENDINMVPDMRAAEAVFQGRRELVR
jgi:hypothetical protein